MGAFTLISNWGGDNFHPIFIWENYINSIGPVKHRMGGTLCTPYICLTLFSCPKLKNSSDDPYLTILDFPRLFHCKCPYEKK